MQISCRRHDKVTIFDLSGDFDFANSRQLHESVLREIQENRTPQVVVNLSAVRYIDSSIVASLVEALKASRNLGVRFILFRLSTPAREVLQLSRLIKVFEIYETEDQAAAPQKWRSRAGEFGHQVESPPPSQHVPAVRTCQLPPNHAIRV